MIEQDFDTAAREFMARDYGYAKARGSKPSNAPELRAIAQRAQRRGAFRAFLAAISGKA